MQYCVCALHCSEVERRFSSSANAYGAVCTGAACLLSVKYEVLKLGLIVYIDQNLILNLLQSSSYTKQKFLAPTLL